MPPHDQTTFERFVNGLPQQVRSGHVFGDDIDQCPEWRRHAHTVNRLDISRTEPRMMQPEHLGEGSHSAESGRHGHVQLRWHDVRKFV